MNIIGGWKTWCAVGDNHGNLIDKDANRAFFQFIDDFQPKIRIHVGDNWDFACLRKKADAEERKISLLGDLEEGNKFVEKYRPHHQLLGNHCIRVFDLAKTDNGAMSDMARVGVVQIESNAKKLGCKLYPYDRRLGIVRIGSLKAIHGFYSGITAARRTALAYGSVLMGHGHGIDHVTIEGIEKRMGRMIGCLCGLSPDYARASVGSLRWAHGWAYGISHERSGKYVCLQAEKIGSKWVIPTEIKLL